MPKLIRTVTVPTLKVPAAHIDQPIHIPSSAEVKDAFDPNEGFASEITPLATVASGEAEIKLVRYDWPDSDPVVGVGLQIKSENVAGWIHCGDNPDPMEAFQRLTELATAASVAAQQLLAMTAAETWK